MLILELTKIMTVILKVIFYMPLCILILNCNVKRSGPGFDPRSGQVSWETCKTNVGKL